MPRILLADNNLSDRLQLRDALERAGYQVDAVDSNIGARTSVGRAPPDLAIVSSSGLGENDIDLVRRLRVDFPKKTLPILVLSEALDVHQRLAALSAGADDHVSKPFEMGHVLSRVRSLLNHKENLPSVTPRGFARRVLVVDDSPTYAYALLDELRKDGHDVALAESGADALAFLERHRTDLVVLDVFLPDINGVEVCRRIKAGPHTAAIPVLILTGRERSAVREGASEAHADDFAVKSRDLDAIRNKVRALLVRPAPASPVSSRDPRASRGQRTPEPDSSREPRAAKAERTLSPDLSREPRSARGERVAVPDSAALFEEIVHATGLSELLARSTVESVCRRLGIAPEEITARDVPRVVEALERTLRLFLAPNEAEDRLAELGTLSDAS